MARPTFEIENAFILDLVQVLYGAVSRNLRAVNISDATESSLSLHFLLAVDDASDREEIDEVAFELEALQEHPIDLKVCIAVGTSFDDFAALPGRGVYHRKEELDANKSEQGNRGGA